MGALTTKLDQILYPSKKNNWDDELLREVILEQINQDSHCLDYGAGRGNVTQMNFKGSAKYVAGIDPEPEVLENPYLDDAKTLDLSTNVIPYPDASFDLVFSDNVMEHVAEPEAVLSEIYRVLKPGGQFIAKTPNKWHYMPIIARITPTSFHRFYNKIRGRNAFDTFPTLYKANSKAAVINLAKISGFKVEEIKLIESRPEYLRITALTYILGWIYEKIVNASDQFEGYRCVMISRLRKPEY